MKLSIKEKDELFEELGKRLEDLPKGQRVHLDKDVLEDLLFEEVTLDKEKNIKVKLPVRSGDVLRKIDLSEVDFSDVSFGILDADDDQLSKKFNYWRVTEDIIDLIKQIRKSWKKKEMIIDYSGTNAPIDLTKTFEAKHKLSLDIINCNFSGLDFSKQNVHGAGPIYICGSNIVETGLSLNSECYLTAIHSCLKGIDLSNRCGVVVDSFVKLHGDDCLIDDCDLTNCGLKIVLGTNKFRCPTQRNLELLKKAMNYDWVGCYVNGKKVLSEDEKKEIAAKKLLEHKIEKRVAFDSIFSVVENQKVKCYKKSE